MTRSRSLATPFHPRTQTAALSSSITAASADDHTSAAAAQPPAFGAGWIAEDRRSEVFGAFAEDYDAFRPSYPPALFDTLLQRHGGSPRNGVDIGCGTGRGALALAARGLAVTGVDTDSGMLKQLRASAERHGTPVTTAQGSAEHTGLPACAADVACCLQAWHWFDAAAALAELRRVLRPGGVAVVAWNDRDLARPQVQRLEALIEKYNPQYERRVRQCDKWAPSVWSRPELMALDKEAVFPHVLQLGSDPEALVQLCMTFSYVRCAVPEGAALDAFQEECRALARDMLAEGSIDLPLHCKAFFLRRV